jgi:hypothetical protein
VTCHLLSATAPIKIYSFTKTRDFVWPHALIHEETPEIVKVFVPGRSEKVFAFFQTLVYDTFMRHPVIHRNGIVFQHSGTRSSPP